LIDQTFCQLFEEVKNSHLKINFECVQFELSAYLIKCEGTFYFMQGNEHISVEIVNRGWVGKFLNFKEDGSRLMACIRCIRLL
jgi:hypothetical protein